MRTKRRVSLSTSPYEMKGVTLKKRFANAGAAYLSVGIEFRVVRGPF